MRPENRNAISLVELLVMVAILGILLGLVLASVHRVRAAAHRISCASNMRQLGIALTLFHDDHGLLPPGMNLTLNGGRFRLAGWGVPLLPYIDQTPLYDVSVRAFGTAKSVLLNPPHQGLEPVMHFES